MSLADAIIQYAEAHLRPYRTNADGSEIIPLLCPFCKGGEHGDQNTFALNVETGLYVCQRGSCGAKGMFGAAMMGQAVSLERDSFTNAVKTRKEYTMPSLVVSPITPEIIAYFEKRRISQATIEAFRLGSDDHGNIVFPFYRDDALVYAKMRKPRKPRGNEPKEWQTPGACPILFGMDACSFSKPLIVTEGEIDAMALAEAGAENVVSVPNGCSSTDWIGNCWDWLERFTKIIIFGDSDAPGRKMVQDVAKRLSEARCYVVEDYPQRGDGQVCKDANEILYYHGAEKLMETLESAQPIPIRGVIQLADVIPYDPTTIPRIKTLIPKLDASIGGLIEGGLTVFTGKPGDGKLLSDDTPVLTKDGWKQHGDLVVGDEVISNTGDFAKVLHVFPKGIANMLVTFSNGETICCHENHEWVVDYHSGNGHKQRIVSTREMYDQFMAGTGKRRRKDGKHSFHYKLVLREA